MFVPRRVPHYVRRLLGMVLCAILWQRPHIFSAHNNGEQDRTKWGRVAPLPALDDCQTKSEEIVLFIKLFKHRKRGNLLFLAQPPALPPARPKRTYQNAVYEGLKLRSFIQNSPTRMTWARASQELQISDSKLAHLLKIVNTLPQEFIESMKSCQDQEKLKIFNGKRLLRISRLRTEKERRNALENLLPKA